MQNNDLSDQHELNTKWLDKIRNAMWSKSIPEDQVIPSAEALSYHWLRVCFMRIMWFQAENQSFILPDMNRFGWKVENNITSIVWDTEENMQHIEQITKGKDCGCTTGCTSKRCKCYRGGDHCRAECKCINCEYLPPGLEMKDL